jgi:integrase
MSSKIKTQNFDDLPLILTVEDVAKILGLSKEETSILCNNQSFPCVTLGEKMIIPKPAFEQWMKNPFVFENRPKNFENDIKTKDKIKKNKRKNGKGSVTQRANGIWMGRIMSGYKPNGKPNSKCVYGKTKSEVLSNLKEIARDIDSRKFEQNTIALKDWLASWLNEYKKNRLKIKTFEVYQTCINTHIANDEFGKIKLKDITNLHIQRFMNQKTKILAPASVRKLYSIINAGLKKATENDLITKNYAIGIELPQLTQRKIKAFTTEEQKKFFEAAKEDALYNLFILAVDSGLRLGEALALTWNDIDFENERINVDKNIIPVKDYENISNSNYIIKLQDTPKTKSSIRKVPMTQQSLNIMKSLCPENKNAIIFSNKNGGYLQHKNVERSFKRIVDKAEIESCNFHTLRHTFATRLFELGVSAKIVSEFLGHSKVSHTLDIYTHVIPGLKNEAIKVLDSLNFNNENNIK